jgi:hypothetical protein
VKKFLGFSSFYRRYVPGYAKIAAPLRELLRKDAKFVWSAECARAFEELKNRLTSPPVLMLPRLDQPYILATDASTQAIGWTLSSGMKING